MARTPIEISIMSRRRLLTGAGSTGAGLFLAACGTPGLSCAAPGQLTRSQQTARDGRQYVERSNVAGRTCTNCTFYNDPEAPCGICAIDNLPAHPEGYCISWAQLEMSQTHSRGAARA